MNVKQLDTRNLPVGVQDFEKIRRKNCVLVDKTEFVYRLAHKMTPFFLSRPRRFGKSFFLTMLKTYWEGKNDLFKGLEIEELEKNNPEAWQPHPVFYMDFDGMNYQKEGGLEEKLDLMLMEWERLYGDQYHSLALENRFNQLLKLAYEKTGKGCVILIDEYDKPLLEVMGHPNLLEHNKGILKGFFSNLKNCDAYIEFIFITGVTKFHKVSIFSDLNNLSDISLEEEYAAICGFTQQELEDCYGPEIDALAKRRKMGREKCLQVLKSMYDGYRFSEKEEYVYNPFSVLRTFDSKSIRPYWFASATPSFLVKRLKEMKCDIRQFTEAQLYTDWSSLSDYSDDISDPVNLLYQSGYLTIKDYNEEDDIYQLGYPNKEVEIAFLKSLLPEYVPSSQKSLGTDIFTLSRHIKNGDVESVMKVFTALFAGITYTREDDPFENYFQAILFIVMTLLGEFVQVERHMYSGRIDCCVMSAKYIYLFEFKRDDTAENALKQIDDKDYSKPFLADERRLFKIGVGFDSEKRILKEWKLATDV